MNRSLSLFNIISLVLGLAFLYIPILLLIIYSFNESRLVSVWGGFSTKWYGVLFNNERLIESVVNTLKVAFMSSTGATLLGTIAGFVLVRLTRFRGKNLFYGMIYAPLVMPEVITGISLLLMFVAISLDRSITTITLAHITFSMCYVAVVVQSRLTNFDRSLEEAAADLGCKPMKTFFYIILPLIAPAIISGWILAFALSLDDLVIASFTAGPNSTTLPMQIYSQVRLGVTPQINAISTILVGIVAVFVLIASIIYKRSIIQQKNKAL